jgi:hypothetical protein
VTPRHLGVAFGLVVSLFPAVSARAEAPPLALEWTAPEGCPGQADVLARVLALVHPSEANGGRAEGTRATVRGVVTRSGGKASLRLETSVTRAARSGGTAPEGAVSGTRQLAGATCDEVTAAGVLVIALAIDPDATTEGTSGTPATGAATPPETPPAEPSPTGPAVPPVAVEKPPPTEAGAAVSAETGSTRVFATGSALLDVGTLPGPALGFRAGAGLSIERVRVELGLGYLLPRFAPADASSSEGGAHVSLFTGNLRGCYVFVPGRIGVDGCLGTEVGALIADGEGFDRSATVTTPWLAVEASTGLAFAISRDLSLGASVGAVVPLGRSTIRYTSTSGDTRTYTELHQPSAVALRLGVGLSFLFR